MGAVSVARAAAVFAAALAVQDGVVQVVGGDRDVSVRRQVPVLARPRRAEARASASKVQDGGVQDVRAERHLPVRHPLQVHPPEGAHEERTRDAGRRRARGDTLGLETRGEWEEARARRTADERDEEKKRAQRIGKGGGGSGRGGRRDSEDAPRRLPIFQRIAADEEDDEGDAEEREARMEAQTRKRIPTPRVFPSAAKPPSAATGPPRFDINGSA